MRTVNAVAEELRDVVEQLKQLSHLFERENELRQELRDAMIEENRRKIEDVHGFDVTIGTRKYTDITDEDQVVRTLTYRGVLNDCLELNTSKVRRILGDDALGLQTREQKYVIVKDNTD